MGSDLDGRIVSVLQFRVLTTVAPLVSESDRCWGVKGTLILFSVVQGGIYV